MPTYEHLCLQCSYEWDEAYSIKANPPTVCPECKQENCVKRLVSGGSGKGIVTLTGKDLSAKIKADAKKVVKDATKNENLMANLVGESRYHDSMTRQQKLETELVKIGKDAPQKGAVKRSDLK